MRLGFEGLELVYRVLNVHLSPTTALSADGCQVQSFAGEAASKGVQKSDEASYCHGWV